MANNIQGKKFDKEMVFDIILFFNFKISSGFGSLRYTGNKIIEPAPNKNIQTRKEV